MQSKIYSYAMKYGIYIGLLIALNTIFTTSGNAIMNILSWGVWGVMVYLMYYFTIKFANTEAEQPLTFGNAFKLNILMYFFGAIIATAIRIVYFKWLNPEVLTELFNQSMLVLDKLNSAEKAAAKDALTQFLKPVSYSFLLLFGEFFSGLIYALIIAAIAKNKNTNNTTQQESDDFLSE